MIRAPLSCPRIPSDILVTPLQRTADPYLSGLTLLDPQLSSHTDHTEGGASAVDRTWRSWRPRTHRERLQRGGRRKTTELLSVGSRKTIQAERSELLVLVESCLGVEWRVVVYSEATSTTTCFWRPAVVRSPHSSKGPT